MRRTSLEGQWNGRDAVALACALLAALAAACWVAAQTGTDFFARSLSDSYTLQALAWRKGQIALDRNYEWLELAVYQGEYYVSFPPVPAIPLWLLTFFFGRNVPSGLPVLLYFLGSVAALYCLLRRYMGREAAALCALFAVLGGSVVDIAVSGGGYAGGPWFQAQMLAFLLLSLAFLWLDGDRPALWGAGLACLALSVGCRPFHALYVPVMLWMLWQKLDRPALGQAIRAMLPYLAAPALIAVAYGAYNFLRFGNPLEFGHSYLPELAEAGEGMFLIARIPENIGYILRRPTMYQGTLRMPIVFGFAVYLTNPMLFAGMGRGVARAASGQADGVDALLLGTLLLHALGLLSHRTNGGWQYGTRYLCDLVPALMFLFARGGKAPRPAMYVAMGLLIAFNVYATVVFHTLS